MAANGLVLCFALSSFGFFNAKGVLGGNPIVDRYLQMATEELVAPLNEVSSDLEATLGEIEDKKQGVMARHRELLDRLEKSPCPPDQQLLQYTSFVKDWDFDSCVNVTDDAREASEIAMAASALALNISEITLSLGNNILNCPISNVMETVKCYNSNLAALKDIVVAFKVTTIPYVRKASEVIDILRLDFDHCLGIPVTSYATIENYIKNCTE